MKNIQAIFYLATMIGGVLSVASCNNENETITASKQVPLEIQTGSVQTTRSIIEGSTLPEECQYGIFAMYGKEREVIDGGMNVCVNYSKGVSTLNKSVYLHTIHITLTIQTLNISWKCRSMLLLKRTTYMVIVPTMISS